MSTADVSFVGTPASQGTTRPQGWARTVAIASVALASALALTACSASYETYDEGFWDNGEGIAVPVKSELFDADGVATCEIPLLWQAYEARADDAKLMAALLFELTYSAADAPEIDRDDYPTEKLYQKALDLQEQRANVTDTFVLYQYTYPTFDAEHGITGPDDLKAVKNEVGSHLFGIGRGGSPITDSIKLISETIDADEGHFVVTQLTVKHQEYMDAHQIPLEFNGFQYTYWVAKSTEIEYLLVVNKDTGETQLWDGPNQSQLTNPVAYASYEVRVDPSQAGADAEFVLQSDGCSERGDERYARFYWLSYTLLDGSAPAPTPSVEPSVEPSPSPSPSPSPTASGS